VLYWVVKGKTNKDIGDIVGQQPNDGKKALRNGSYVELRRSRHAPLQRVWSWHAFASSSRISGS